MAISQNVHKAVVVITSAKNGDAVALGFDTTSDAVYFFEVQITEEAEKFAAIQEAMDEGYTTEGGVKFRIYDIETWLDLYEGDDDDNNE